MCVFFFREEGGGGWEMLGLCVWIGSTFIEMLIDESKTPTCVPADIEMKSLEYITFLIEHIKYTYFAICKAHQIFCRFQHWTTLSLWISILNLFGNCLISKGIYNYFMFFIYRRRTMFDALAFYSTERDYSQSTVGLTRDWYVQFNR